MKNSVLVFENVPCRADGMLDGKRTGVLGLPLYNGTLLARAKEVLQNLDRIKYLGILELSNNVTLEKISWQIYKSPDYWDILLLVNDIDPLFGMPYDYDTVSESTTSQVDKYAEKVYRGHLSDKDRQRLHDAIAAKDSEANEAHRRIYYVYPEKIYEIRHMLYEQGITNVA